MCGLNPCMSAVNPADGEVAGHPDNPWPPTPVCATAGPG